MQKWVFVQNGKCKECDDTNCVLCNANECTECETGMMLVKGKCQRCDLICCWHTECSLEGCLKCETTSDKCAECDSGFYLDSGKCFQCEEEHCKECEKKGETVECTNCEEGFTTNNGGCICLKIWKRIHKQHATQQLQTAMNVPQQHKNAHNATMDSLLMKTKDAHVCFITNVTHSMWNIIGTMWNVFIINNMHKMQRRNTCHFKQQSVQWFLIWFQIVKHVQ